MCYIILYFSRKEQKSEYILTFLSFNDYLIIDLLLFSHKMKNNKKGKKGNVFQDIKKRSKEK